MKRIFDDAVNPSNVADLQAKALEQKILMASKGADGDDSVAGGYKAKGATKSGNSIITNKKKASDTYLDIVMLQQAQIRDDLNGMMGDLGKLGDDLHKIDLRMAERNQTLKFIEQNLHDESDLTDSNGDYNPRVQALLAKHGKEDLSPDQAYIFLTQTLTQDLYDAQAADQKSRDDVADKIRDKQSAIQDKIDQGRALGMDMSEEEQAVAVVMDNISNSIERAEAAVNADHANTNNAYEGLDDLDFLLNDTPSL